MAYAVKTLNEKKRKCRASIVQSAINVFAQKGFHNTKISDIAKVANVADGTIYLYFDNKDDLLIRCFEEMITALLDSAKEKLSSIENRVERILRFIDLHFEYCINNRDSARLMIIELRQSPEFYSKYPDFWPINHYLNFLRELCADAINSQHIRQIDPELLTTIIFGSLDFTMTTWLMSKITVDFNKIKDGIADIIYHGLEIKDQEI